MLIPYIQASRYGLLKSVVYPTRTFHCLPVTLKDPLSDTVNRERLVEINKKWAHEVTLNAMEGISNGKQMMKKKYILSMFPYPSGMLHLGHLRVYVISDVLNRFYKQNKYDVLHPMGWDAFGLPAENAAIERGIRPSLWTETNIKKMKEQMNSMLANFDWTKEVNTSDPNYYKFTQWIFVKLFKNGLAYQKESAINWDPVDETVLANEQVDANGKSWRSGAKVEKRMLKQWFLGITKFAEQLNEDLVTLNDWPNKVKTMQKNWIGRSEGADVNFKILLSDETSLPNIIKNSGIDIFTTRIETIFAVQFLAISINHPVAQHYSKNNIELKTFIAKYQNVNDHASDSKEGYQLPGIFVINPLTNAKVPVYVAPYVLDNYGHGAVMGVPSHDKRDKEFWEENSAGVILPSVFDKVSDNVLKCIMNANVLKEYQSVTVTECREKIINHLEANNIGKASIKYKLRDWLISRQRYWGTPIPIIHCHDCGAVPVPEADLPVLLPDVDSLTKRGNPLSSISSFVEVNCPSCNKPAKRETDTMDTFIDSSWYYFRYTDSKNDSLPITKQNADKSMPVDIYIGGVEHAILHLLYSRFISKFLKSIGQWDGTKAANAEPFKKLVTQGMVQGKTYVNPRNGQFMKPNEIKFTNDSDNPVVTKDTEEPLNISYEKMSKSKYNGIDPMTFISQHGADATRAHILFQAPIEKALNWDSDKIVGTERWLNKTLHICENISQNKTSDIDYVPSIQELNKHEIKFNNDFSKLHMNINMSFKENLSLNTVVSDYMKMTNLIEIANENFNINKNLLIYNLKKLITIMYPVTPTISAECANLIKKGQNWTDDEWDQYSWPNTDEPIIVKEQDYMVFVNGKMRFKFAASTDFVKLEESCIVTELLKTNEGKKYLLGKTIKKIILKQKVISFIV
ncbi:hypothetical protein TPHA_0B02310 [Tetrapisispora phaffii CBS 4417]|uniref:leucine--tRNA ligase n=1 Tax=Tetrapisispora phaffii (strain ATCC 24235 / CBS 4417 / NBRC 1672 / NRRL Y-8282 / UCD 70-5) TaxID=1071381 RepID=G8BPH2_TETPH|nr:hypothetical protein TPHA_0B02310 [Tetrapisispora phaffii CBS 4417]CCE61903.1 hypothetical protein TPHA_0B02310 [Tetrapisispora phaffii CBS 4417]